MLSSSPKSLGLGCDLPSPYRIPQPKHAKFTEANSQRSSFWNIVTMSLNHLSSTTVPPEASTQSPSVPIDARASSQSEDAQPTISEPGYRKHSLGDILQSPGGTDAKQLKSSAQVPSASQNWNPTPNPRTSGLRRADASV